MTYLLFLTVFIYTYFFMLMFGLRDKKLTDKEEDTAVWVAIMVAGIVVLVLS